MTTINPHTTRANGTILTAAIYNADHNNHISNATALNSSKLEGAAPPVVDGQVAVWDGTSGAALRTGGAFPVATTRNLTAGTGLTGGGNLTADRSFAVDFAAQAEAEAGTSIVDVMSPLRVAQRQAILLASQAEAEGQADNTKTMTPLRVLQQINFRLATQAEAEAGVEATHLMTALRTAQAIAALASSVTLGAALSTFNQVTPWDTGIDDIKGGIVLIIAAGTAGNMLASANGGTNYTGVGNFTAGQLVLAAIKNGIIVVAGASATATLTRTALTAGAGNVFFSSNGGGNHTGIRII